MTENTNTHSKFNKAFLPGLSISKSQALGIQLRIRALFPEAIKEGVKYKIHSKKTSVTSILDSCKPFVKDDHVNNLVAAARGKGRPEHSSFYLERWGYMKKERAARGQRVHHFAAAYPRLDIPSDGYEKAVVTFYENVISNVDHGKYHFIATDLVTHTEEIAGTIDLLLYDLTRMKFIVVDFKIDGNFSKTSTDYFTDKLSHVPYSKYNYCALQLSFYQTILEGAGVPVSERWVVNIKNGSYEIIKVDQLTIFQFN